MSRIERLSCALKSAGLPVNTASLVTLSHFCRRLSDLQPELDGRSNFIQEVAYALSAVHDSEFLSLRRFDLDTSPGYKGFRPAMQVNSPATLTSGEIVHLYIRHMARIYRRNHG